MATTFSYITIIFPKVFCTATPPFPIPHTQAAWKPTLYTISTLICPLAHWKTSQLPKQHQNPLFIQLQQVLNANELSPQSSNYFVSPAFHNFLHGIYWWNYFLLEQAKAGKEQAAKDKAYQEAIWYQQRQEEILGFHKLPAQAPFHDMWIFCWQAMLTLDK